MKRDASYRYTSHSRFGPTLDWEGLPTVGADHAPAARSRLRARAWCIALLAVALFWGGVFFWAI